MSAGAIAVLRPLAALLGAISRAIVFDRIHGAAEFDVVIVGTVEITGDIAAGFAVAEQAFAIIPIPFDPGLV